VSLSASINARSSGGVWLMCVSSAWCSTEHMSGFSSPQLLSFFATLTSPPAA
jgi:hypothetical protein